MLLGGSHGVSACTHCAFTSVAGASHPVNCPPRLPCCRSCLAAAKAMQEKLLKEDGIGGTVDHIHRTIYGALLDGIVYK